MSDAEEQILLSHGNNEPKHPLCGSFELTVYIVAKKPAVRAINPNRKRLEKDARQERQT